MQAKAEYYFSHCSSKANRAQVINIRLYSRVQYKQNQGAHHYHSQPSTNFPQLAREALFGEDIMAQCTVAGERGLPGLPTAELQQLKQSLFVQFPVVSQEFEALWKTATAAIGKAYKRLRSKNVPTLENIFTKCL